MKSMALFNRNPDPLTGRSKELNAKIAALESRIKKLNHELKTEPAGMAARPSPQFQPSQPAVCEPIFEKVHQNPLETAEPVKPDGHYNDLGVRKYDLLSLLARIRKQVQGAPPANPKLVNYLAVGSIQGLRPLRYEKRVARNRCIALAALLLLAFVGIFYALEHRR